MKMVLGLILIWTIFSLSFNCSLSYISSLVFFFFFFFYVGKSTKNIMVMVFFFLVIFGDDRDVFG